MTFICDDHCQSYDPYIWTTRIGSVNTELVPGYFTMYGQTEIQCVFSGTLDICLGPCVIQEGTSNPTQFQFAGVSDALIGGSNIILWRYPYLGTIELNVPGSPSFSCPFTEGHLYMRIYVDDKVHVLLDNYSTFSDPLVHLISETVLDYKYLVLGTGLLNSMLSTCSVDYVKNVVSNRAVSNPMEGMSPVATFAMCDISHGVEIASANYWRIILICLRESLIAYQKLEPIIIQTFSLVMPSSLAIPMIINGEVVDFVPEEKRYWAWNVSYKGFVSGAVALPRVELSDKFFENILAPMNQPIEGSENFYFRDSDGIIKQGTEMDPVRYYYPLSDGSKDAALIALVLGVIYVINKFGLVKVAVDFSKRILTYMRTRKLRNNIDEISDKVDSIIENTDGVEESIKSLAGKIGLRFTLRT